MNHLASALWKYVMVNWQRIALGCVSLVIFLTGWWLTSNYLHAEFPFEGVAPSANRDVLPDPRQVYDAFVDAFLHRDPVSDLFMTSHIFASLKRIFFGFILAFALGMPIGLLMGRSSNSNAFARPIVEIFRPIPPLAWVPIFLIGLGLFWGPVAIVFLGIFFPILLNVTFGAKSVEPVLIDAARTLGAKKSQLFAMVVLPSTLPYMMTGIKVGLGIGWMCIVAAEMLGSVGGGVGYYIYNMAFQASMYDRVFAGMVVIGLLSVLTTGVAELIERRLYKWMGMK